MMDLTQKQWVKHSVFHPFEGFEDLRWKKGGSVLYASIVILLWFVAKILHDNLVGYQFAVTNTKMFSIVPYIVQTIAVFLVFVIGNWSICTLLDGEGTIKKIYIYSAYSMIPYVAGLYIRTLLSHVLIQDEVIFITCVTVISTAWSVLLMFNAIKAVHQYSISKTILALLLTFVAMLIILILLVLLWLLMKPLNAIVTRLPLVSTVNGLGGAALGLVCGGLTLFVVVWAMQRFGWLITPELVEKTPLLKFFATHTPLGLLATL